jgi:transposase
MYYVGLDIHKRTIAYCATTSGGTVKLEGEIPSTRAAIRDLAGKIGTRWVGAMEATIFTGWVYDEFMKYGHRLRVASPSMLKYISGGKKSDRIDARKLSDLLRCNLLPEVVMESSEIRELRMVLRFRTLLVRTAVKMKNKTAGLLMESGAEYEKADLRSKRRFGEMLESLEDVPQSVIDLARMSRDAAEFFETLQKRLVKGLTDHPEIRERVRRLRSIPGVGEITALTWALEIGDPSRFPSRRKAISYCGLCSELKESAGKQARGPLTKRRNSHLQSVLVEAAKMAPRFNPQLREVHERELMRGNRNRATLAVARKLVAYMLSVDRSGKEFEPRKMR